MILEIFQMIFLEKRIEGYLRAQVALNGGKCYKWQSPQNAGVPDRIVFIYKQVWFIELKRPGGELRKLQEIVGRAIKEHIDNYCVLSTLEEVDDFIKLVKEQDNVNK